MIDETDDERRRRHAPAGLLDEIGASARGELPIPDQAQLSDWLRLPNVVAGSDGSNANA
jgi:hypothetical protein